jgi:CheY-like chemotaxis protein
MDKKTILLVEDDTFVSDIYQTKISSEGFNMMVAENGLEAIKRLEEKIPDLILLDIIMPYMDGIETLKKIKADERWKKIPVILLTNLSEKEKIEIKSLKRGECLMFIGEEHILTKIDAGDFEKEIIESKKINKRKVKKYEKYNLCYWNK